MDKFDIMNLSDLKNLLDIMNLSDIMNSSASMYLFNITQSKYTCWK